ncbi:plasmid partitioning protein RepB C-terminal domain-containing protein [Yersinia enterocolitica]|nr:ParB N-terminal domain-containing protein [Yersinia enterocolitica]HDM8312608.1 ParB N-terminal domain-containing protein [Yersinia enterocolitica]HDU2654085.1 ParB N-terminal domain-containing protein [Yersinia enterocolitica]HDV7144314.1 ParB N-terminal domain-containing protein [Yersinia enterocolitica]HDW3093902.1 ParB N-terminal domain-containing protein [Yersinia enterocolitica]
MVSYCFERNSVKFNIDDLIPTKKPPINVKNSKKYLQIKKSINSIGIIEPIVVYLDSKLGKVKILDGHLRIEALKELGETEAICLVSTIYDTYTPNSKVSRITIIQEQKMIRKALKSGVSIEKLSEALGISIDILKVKINLLDGIDPEVVNLLANQNVPKATFYALRKMKNIRQIECACIMNNMENYSEKFSLSLLHNTQPNLLVDGQQGNDKEGHRKTIDRLEREMAQVHIESEKLKESYGENTLRLVIMKSHIQKLLENTKILHWLLDNKNELLVELKKITNINSLTK